MMFQKCIDQSGSVTCPLCKNVIDWSLTVEKYKEVYHNGTIPTVIKSEPKYIGYDFNSDGSMNVVLGCTRCCNNINIRSISLIK